MSDAAPSSALRLSLASNRMPLARLMELVEAMPTDKVVELNAAQNDLGDQAPLLLLRSLPSLTSLSVSSSGVGVEGIRALVAELMEREAPQHTQFPFFPDGQPAGEGSPAGLTSLDLSGCSVDGAAPELGAYLASPQCGLASLDLSFNTFGPDALGTLTERFRVNRTLRTLRFAHCHLKEEAAILLNGIGAEDCEMPLRSLCLSRNALPQSVFHALGVFLSTPVGLGLTDLDISANTAIADDPCSRSLGAAFLHSSSGTASSLPPSPAAPAAAPALGCGGGLRLDLSGTRPFVDAAFGRWEAADPHALVVMRSPLCRVTEVVLDQCTFSETAMPLLARVCLNARVFSLCGRAAGETFVQTLADTVRSMAQRRAASREGGGTPAAASGNPVMTAGPSLPSQQGRGLRLCLQELRLNDASLQDQSAALLAEALDHFRAVRRDGRDVEVLEVAGNHFTADAADSLGSQLVRSPGLRRLNLSRNRLRTHGATRLSEWLVRTECNDGVAPPSPLRLELRRCGLTAEGALQVWRAALAAAASGGRAVGALDLAENAVDDACLEAIQASLSDSQADCGTLRHLNLLPNPCSGGQVARLLACAAPLQAISVHGAALEAAHVAQLFGCLGPGCLGQDSEEYVLSLKSTSMLQRHWDWSVVTHALRSALVPVSAESRPQLSPTRRVGGCGGTLLVELDSCELAKASFKLPQSVPAKPAGKSAQNASTPPAKVSLAQNARRLADARTKACLEPRDAASSRPRPLSLADRARGAASACSSPAPAGSSSAVPASLAAGVHGIVVDGQGVFTLSSMVKQDPMAAAASAGIGINGCSVSLLGGAPSESDGVCSSQKDWRLQHNVYNANGGSSTATPIGTGASSPTSRSHSAGTIGRGCFVGTQASIADILAQVGSSRGSGNASPGGPARGGSLVDQAARLGSSAAGGASSVAGGVSSAASAGGTDSPSAELQVSRPPLAPNGVPALHRISNAFQFGSHSSASTFERDGNPELEVSTVLRGLRGIEALRLLRCRLTDGWLSQLCCCGGKAKWSDVRVLDLRQNRLTEACCSALATVVAGGLEVLLLDGNRLRAQGFQTLCAAIKPNQRCSMRMLSVADNEIGQLGGNIASALLSQPGGCPLHGLRLAKNTQLGIGSMVAILKSLCRQDEAGRSLEFIDLSACGVSPPLQLIMRTLAHCPMLSMDLTGLPPPDVPHTEAAAGEAPSTPSAQHFEFQRLQETGRLRL